MGANGATAEQVLRVLGMVPSAGEESAWEIVASMAKKPRVVEAAPRAQIFKFESAEAVAKLIAKSQRIFVLAGAGISVACGLPTFRDDDKREAIAREFGLST